MRDIVKIRHWNKSYFTFSIQIRTISREYSSYCRRLQRSTKLAKYSPRPKRCSVNNISKQDEGTLVTNQILIVLFLCFYLPQFPWSSEEEQEKEGL